MRIQLVNTSVQPSATMYQNLHSQLLLRILHPHQTFSIVLQCQVTLKQQIEIRLHLSPPLHEKSFLHLMRMPLLQQLFPSSVITSVTFVLTKISAPFFFAWSAKNLYVFRTSSTAAFACSSLIETLFFGEQKLYVLIGL